MFPSDTIAHALCDGGVTPASIVPSPSASAPSPPSSCEIAIASRPPSSSKSNQPRIRTRLHPPRPLTPGRGRSESRPCTPRTLTHRAEIAASAGDRNGAFVRRFVTTGYEFLDFQEGRSASGSGAVRAEAHLDRRLRRRRLRGGCCARRRLRSRGTGDPRPGGRGVDSDAVSGAVLMRRLMGMRLLPLPAQELRSGRHFPGTGRT